MESYPQIVMRKIREAVDASGQTREELGVRMGYKPESARKSVSQFLHRTTDPRLSMIAKFAEALGVEPRDFM
jgi:transcriptional regulator with XRE-family HTH domain